MSRATKSTHPLRSLVTITMVGESLVLSRPLCLEEQRFLIEWCASFCQRAAWKGIRPPAQRKSLAHGSREPREAAK